MRDLNEFYYVDKYIEQKIEDSKIDTKSQIARVIESDGISVTCELIKSQEGLSQIKKIPIVQSNYFHEPVMPGDYGLLLNIGHIPADFFLTGRISTAIIDLPFYLFLPLIISTSKMGIYTQDTAMITGVDGRSGISVSPEGMLSISSENSLFINSNNNGMQITSKAETKLHSDDTLDITSMKAISIQGQDALEITSAKDTTIESSSGAMTLKSAKDTTIESSSGAMTLKSAQPMDLNASNIAAVIQKLHQTLSSVVPAPVPPGSPDPTWATLIGQLAGLAGDIATMVSKLK